MIEKIDKIHSAEATAVESRAPRRPEKGFMSKVAERGKRFAQIFALLATFSGAAEKSEARPDRPTAARTEKMEKQTEQGRVEYLSIHFGKQKLEAEGNPEVDVYGTKLKITRKADKRRGVLVTEGSFIRSVEDSGREHFKERLVAEGEERPTENPFGFIDGFPAVIQKAKNPELARADANMKLLGMWQRYRILKGFYDLNKGAAPEAKFAAQEFMAELVGFEQKFPGLIKQPKDLRDILGEK
ncbi:MAG: hypothetical protein AAB731_03035 [Patescibacteria group bacterium]